jgi:hypothetical protein
MITRDTMRRRLVEILYDRVKNPYITGGISNSLLKQEVLIDRALRIENQMFRTQGMGKAYFDKSRSIIFNLSDQKNIEPLLKLLKWQITPEDFVVCDMRKLASDKMKKDRDEA